MSEPPPPPYGGTFGNAPAAPPPPPPPGVGAPDQTAVNPGPPGTNGFAIAALICGILAPCGAGLLALIFGIIALVQLKKSGQKGRGMAITGLVLTGAWAVIGVIALMVIILLGANADRNDDGEITSAGSVDVTELQVGDCIEELTEGPTATTVPAVPCSEPHVGEVYALFDLADGEWPGEDIVLQEAQDGCVDRLFDYSRAAYEDDQVDIFYVYPTSATWRTGDREVVCLTYYLDGPRTGSLPRG